MSIAESRVFQFEIQRDILTHAQMSTSLPSGASSNIETFPKTGE
jgi:hypothetical protein